MTEPLERDAVIELLNKLGSDKDEEVLEAARQVHAKITAADMTWEDLLVPDQAEADVDDPEDNDDVEEQGDEDQEEEAAKSPAEIVEENAESLKLIEKLLAKSEISDDLRDELKGYKDDISEGEFEDRDRNYLRTLAERLAKVR